MKKFFGLSIILAMCLLLFSAGHSLAQKVAEEIKKPMPEIPLIPAEQWEAESVLYEEAPTGEKAISFQVRLGDDWTKITDGEPSTYEVSNKIFGEIARYYGPPQLLGARSRLTVQTLELEYELSAEQWFLQHVMANGYSVQGMKTVNEERVEALHVLIENQISYIVRTIVQIVGKQVVLAEYYMPVERWNEEQSLQATIMNSFTFERKDNSGEVEKLEKYLFLDIAEVQYPESWRLRASPLRSIDSMSAQFLNVSKLLTKENALALNGRVDIKLVSVFSAGVLEDEVEIFKKEFLEDSLEIGEVMEEPAPYDISDLFEFADVQVFDVKSKVGDLRYELWVSSMLAGEYYYFVSLLTPSRDQDYNIWVRNTQTYRIMNELIVPLEENVAQR